MDVSRLQSSDPLDDTVGRVHDESVDSSDLLIVDGRRLLLVCLEFALGLRRVFLLGFDALAAVS